MIPVLTVDRQAMDKGIRCSHLWKRYRHQSARYRTLRDDLSDLARRMNPFRRSERSEKGDRYLWALRDISLTVAPGEALGIIGANGSGKSTLLRLLAGVTYPTRGSVEVRGRLGALIDIGAGMHPELTGRENIYLYGSLIGLNRREVQRKFDAIVSFAELEDFLDEPVKRYSTGMKIRLGFSIAVHVDPDILLVDEVLAVGDAVFQRKCLERIKAMIDSDIMILYVSHELTSLERLCQRAIWMDHGVARQIGPSSEVVRAYLDDVEAHLASSVAERLGSPSSFLLDRVQLTDRGGAARTHFRTGEALTVSLFYESSAAFVPAQVAVKLLDSRLSTVAMAVWERNGTDRWPGRGVIRCTFETLPLSPRLYQVWGQVLREPDLREEIPWALLATFPVVDRVQPTGSPQVVLRGREAPLMVVPTRWEVDEAPVTARTEVHAT